jgi:dolichol-phosphate mannosyltransferase
MTKLDLLISAVAVVRDQAGILPAFVAETSEVLARHYTNHEIVLVDNGSTDATGRDVAALLGRYPCVRYLRLTRPESDEIAMMAGLDAAIGDYVATLHADFDPPAEAVPMVEACRSGSDLVLGVYRNPPRRGWLYAALRRVFRALKRRLIRESMATGTSGYRVLSRQAINSLVKVRQRRRYFAVVAADVGLTTSLHLYDWASRSGRKPTSGLGRSIRVGLSVLLNNSMAPLRLASGLGLAGSLLSLLYSFYVVLIYLFKPDVMPGWTTLSLAMSGLFTLAFLMLAMIGEAIGRLLDESSNRPLYHLREEMASSVMLADLTRLNVMERSDDGPIAA